MKLFAFAFAFGSCCLAAMVAAPFVAATPRPAPFSYPYATLAKGRFELEQYVDMTPVRVPRENADGDLEAIFSQRVQLQTEFEIGVTDRLEFSFYLVFRQNAAEDPVMRFMGVKQRLRYRFFDEGVLPVDLGVYVEVAEYHNELELEEKILLSRRFGALTAVVNLWVEQEYYYADKDWQLTYNPTVAAHYEFSPRLSLGAEYWLRGRFDDDVVDPPGTSFANNHHYLGPTVFLQSGEFFLTTGVYVRMDHLNESLTVGDPFGRFWVRFLVGMGF